MKAIFALIVALSTSVVAIGQDDREGLTRTNKTVAAATGPVTKAEARTALIRADRIVRTALKLPGSPTAKIVPGTTPVGRAEVVAEFARLYALVLPSAKITPRPVLFDSARLRATGATRSQLTTLIRAGAVAPVGRLAVGPQNSLTVEEFGDALGFFLSRMAEITHMPSRKWTPALQDE